MMRYFCALMLLCVMIGSATAQETPAPTSSPAPSSNPIFYFYTYHRINGNRIVPGTGSFPNVPGYDVQLDSVPVWVVGGNVPGDIPRWQVRDALGYSQLVIRP